jgi:hypothetical protein
MPAKVKHRCKDKIDNSKSQMLLINMLLVVVAILGALGVINLRQLHALKLHNNSITD